jgi:D-beta-D-heptose 7-phosphate kinase/D-beta-D-heptose 1-phosphate adenosyltransferase
VLFDEPTPLELITALAPDVLVKGGDYTRESIVGASAVEAIGGRVVVIPLTAGYSTTDLVERCRAAT